MQMFPPLYFVQWEFFKYDTRTKGVDQNSIWKVPLIRKSETIVCFFSRYQTLLEMGGKGAQPFLWFAGRPSVLSPRMGTPPPLRKNCRPALQSPFLPALRKLSKSFICKLQVDIDTRSREQTLETPAISAKTIFDPHKNLVWRIMIASCWGGRGGVCELWML